MMPKGQKRDDDTRLSEIDSQLEKLQKRKAELAKIKADKEKRLRLRRAFLIGETILDADLHHEERAMLCRIISRRAEKPKDWDKISDFTIHSVPSSPVSLKPAAREFSRTSE
jgi:hypothetical protein